MDIIRDIETLETLYGTAQGRAKTKVTDHITPLYAKWIKAARFLVMATTGPEGTDASPRGDSGPVTVIKDRKTILLPDWRGNNRLDSLRNIIRDGRISLMYMVHGANNVIRINGRAELSIDLALISAFEKNGQFPKTVIIIHIEEVYFQCAKALMRSDLWQGATAPNLPSAGDLIREQEADFDAESYDSGYADYAKSHMW